MFIGNLIKYHESLQIKRMIVFLNIHNKNKGKDHVIYTQILTENIVFPTEYAKKLKIRYCDLDHVQLDGMSFVLRRKPK